MSEMGHRKTGTLVHTYAHLTKKWKKRRQKEEMEEVQMDEKEEGEEHTQCSSQREGGGITRSSTNFEQNFNKL